MAAASNDLELQVVTDMIIIDFFFLLRPGEYTDVTFSVGRTVFDTATATDNELSAAVFVILVFAG